MFCHLICVIQRVVANCSDYNMLMYLNVLLTMDNTVRALNMKHIFKISLIACSYCTKLVQLTLVINAYDIHGLMPTLRGALIFYPRPNFKACYLRRTFSRLIKSDSDDKWQFAVTQKELFEYNLNLWNLELS